MGTTGAKPISSSIGETTSSKSACSGKSGAKLLAASSTSKSLSNVASIGIAGAKSIGLSNSAVSLNGASIGTVGARMGHSGQKRLDGSVGVTTSPILLAIRVDICMPNASAIIRIAFIVILLFVLFISFFVWVIRLL